jgi:hypothetical protein
MKTEDVDIFIKENDAWDDMIGRQKNELPSLANMLRQAIMNRNELDEQMLEDAEMLRKALLTQDEKMHDMKETISGQKKFLSKKLNGNWQEFGEHSLQRQRILREQIKIVQKKYFELKSDLMNYVWSVL